MAKGSPNGINREEAERLIDNKLAEIRNLVKPQGWRKARERIISFGAPAAIVGLFLGSLGITAGALYQSFAHVKEETEFRTKTNDRLDRIDESIKALFLNGSPNTPPLTALKEMGSFKPNTLAVALPALRKATEKPIANVNAETLSQVAKNLAQVNPATPDYWSTIFQFIQSASFSINQDVPPPGPPFALDVEENVSMTMEYMNYTAAAIYFGGTINLKNATFKNCRIVVGPKAVVRFSNVTFINCAFVFPSPGPPTEPSPSLKEMAKYVLESGLQHVAVPRIG